MAPLVWWQSLAIDVVRIAVIIGALLGLFSGMTYVERRTLAFMQFRRGPNRTGWFGVLQPVADGIKLFFKEEVIPAGAHRWLFMAAPAVSIVTAFTAIAVVPYGGSVRIPHLAFLPSWLQWARPPLWLQGRTIDLQIADLDVGLLFLFAVSSLSVYAIVLAGWSANNKYTLLGGLRSSAQLFSYELALGLSWVGIVMLAGSFSIKEIVVKQGAGILHWYCFLQLPAFLIYLVAQTAEVNRTPFDLPEAETELVAGFHTEYSSMRFALLQMAEYVNMITASAVGSDLFLGGWMSPFPATVPVLGAPSFFWWLAKLCLFLFFFIWLRGTVPRLRYDQLMAFGWKVLVPTATVWVLATAALVTGGVLK